jgi:hypothetical protein
MIFTLWMAVDAVRRSRNTNWLWIMLVFNPLGAVVYFFAEYLDGPTLLRRFTGQNTHRVTADDLRHAEAEVHRLDNVSAWLTYASALRARRQYGKAVEAAQRAVARSPSNVDAQYELALALIDSGKAADAMAPLEEVVSRDRSFDSEQALFLLARAHFERNDVAAARKALEEISGRSSRPEYLYQLASIQAQMGDREVAARTLQRIIQEAELVPPYLRGTVRPWVRKARGSLRKIGY